MGFEDFWYVVSIADRLKSHTVLSRTVLGEWLAIFRGEDGSPVALLDRCMHRHSKLSNGKVEQGKLHCPYHGWVYDQNGKVVAVPAEGENFKMLTSRCAKSYATKEQDGYIYVKLNQTTEADLAPFKMPFYGEKGWETVRVVNRFRNDVTNCAENFIDIPHTVSVHPGVFRSPRKQRLDVVVERRHGSVFVDYRNETTNLGWYSRFLNFNQDRIRHTDSFHMPNITSVEYNLGKHRRLFITSQSIPEADDSTLVYTDITFNYGIWNKLARPFVWWTAQYIINQDIEILGIQQDSIDKYGKQFSNTPADTIHVFVESIRDRIAQGKDPRDLPEQSVKLSFWV